jgi:hypothetical protein
MALVKNDVFDMRQFDLAVNPCTGGGYRVDGTLVIRMILGNKGRIFVSA